MPRLGPIVFCALLAIGSSADAKCEWVMWVESPVGSDQWSITRTTPSTFEAKGDCDRRAEALNNLERSVAKIEHSTGEALDLFTCLPCTVDPRP